MQRLQESGFVQVYMFASIVAFAVFGTSFPVGARWGSRAGARVLVGGLVVHVGTLVGTTIWAVATGAWSEFGRAIGFGVLGEMAVFVALFLYIAYFMPARYLSDKRREEMNQTNHGAVNA